MRLYEIDDQLIELLDRREALLEDLEGEVTEEVESLESAIDMLEINREQKLENIALYIKSLKAETKAIRDEEKSLAGRRKSSENRVESLTGYLSYALDGAKFKTPRVSISYRRSVVVNIVDEESIPSEYIREKIVLSADKTAIKSVIQGGGNIDGAELVEKQNIQIK